MEEEQEKQSDSEPKGEGESPQEPEAPAEAQAGTDPETEEGPAAEPQAEKLPQGDYPQAPPTFEQFLLSVASRRLDLDGAGTVFVREVLRPPGLKFGCVYQLPDGSILIRPTQKPE